MSMFSIFNVSGSAISAQSQRLNVVASNLANVDAVAGPDGKAYNARQGVGLSAGRVRHARWVFRLPCIFGSHVFGIGNHQRFFCSAGQRVIDNTDSANQ